MIIIKKVIQIINKIKIKEPLSNDELELFILTQITQLSQSPNLEKYKAVDNYLFAHQKNYKSPISEQFKTNSLEIIKNGSKTINQNMQIAAILGTYASKYIDDKFSIEILEGIIKYMQKRLIAIPYEKSEVLQCLKSLNQELAYAKFLLKAEKETALSHEEAKKASPANPATQKLIDNQKSVFNDVLETQLDIYRAAQDHSEIEFKKNIKGIE